jgi:hypothetical protein
VGGEEKEDADDDPGVKEDGRYREIYPPAEGDGSSRLRLILPEEAKPPLCQAHLQILLQGRDVRILRDSVRFLTLSAEVSIFCLFPREGDDTFDGAKEGVYGEQESRNEKERRFKYVEEAEIFCREDEPASRLAVARKFHALGEDRSDEEKNAENEEQVNGSLYRREVSVDEAFSDPALFHRFLATSLKLRRRACSVCRAISRSSLCR